MSRLVSSRLHRCYSRGNATSNARAEILTAFLHVAAAIGLFASRDWAVVTGLSKAPTTPRFVHVGASFLLVLVHGLDFCAAMVAHRMFYRWPRVYRRPRSLLSIPSKADGLVVSAYLCGSVVLLASAVGLAGTKWTSASIPSRTDTIYSLMCVLGAVLNLVLSLPTLDFNVSLVLARFHNLICTTFCIAAVVKLQGAIIVHTTAISDDARRLFSILALAADTVVVFAAFGNLLRIFRFLSKTQYRVTDEVKGDSDRNKKGLFAWFKSSRSSPDGSDVDSDLADDYDPYDEDIQKPLSRRMNV